MLPITMLRLQAQTRHPSFFTPKIRISLCCGSNHIALFSSKLENTPISNALKITETIHSRKRIYILDKDLSQPLQKNIAKLTYLWQDQIEDPNKNRQPNKPTSPSFVSTVISAIPHPINSWARQTFLPIGFPDSVHPSYSRVHILQFAETFLWSTVTVLCSQSMLESLGVASPATTGGAVAIQWVLKDQFGEIGKLLFINRFARSLDSHPKTWKFIGEIASLCGALLQLCTILNPSPAWFLTFASLGYSMRSINFSIDNSTHMTFTRNFAVQGNVGDIVAKDDSQETIAHLFGLVTGIALLSFNHSPMFLFSCFFLIGPLHYYTITKILNAIRFEVVSATKMLLLGNEYVRNGRVLNYGEIESGGETMWFGEWIPKGWSGVKVSKIGGSVDVVFDGVYGVRTALEVMKEEDYLIGYRADTQAYGITYHEDASPNDVMKSIVHLTKLDSRVKEIEASGMVVDFGVVLAETLEWTRHEYPKFAVEVEAKGWLTDAVFWGDEGNRCTWMRRDK
ncbi:hypothetical protein HK100_004401 [Physocladia obscura]|uniref:Protein root UVB sensitive/RUS domain-containing protein n=1 Tax=Physocladia obscura TaxID=109957 RepID=A0AAD5SUG7_9FUNG|nr:hypothetical protein HK100_004401 [Physocladia obscura]